MTISDRAGTIPAYNPKELQTLELITNGRDGNHGAKGAGGSRGGTGGRGGLGGRGGDGLPGADAGNIELIISPDPSANSFRISALGKLALFPIGNPNRNIFLSAKGGKGGNGGAGGSGGPGGTGSRGQNATRSSNGTNGGSGGSGGRGGDGGVGKDGGKGGHVVVRVDEEDTDALMYINVPEVSGGKRGTGGHGGRGGSGGSGGEGGSSYSYQTSYTTYTSGGNGAMIPVTHYQSHTNRGGYRGASGARGSSGVDGVHGVKGAEGLFEIVVNHSGKDVAYNDLYRLSIESVTLRGENGDGIFEPGEKVECWLKVKNIGGMPTPPNHSVTFSVRPKGGVKYKLNDPNVLVLDESLKPGEEATFPKPLMIGVSYPREVSVGFPLDVTEQICYRATMGRVNIPFQSVETQYTSLRVQFPVQITSHIGADAITLQEAAPFAFSIRNISTKTLSSDDLREVQMLIKGFASRYFAETDFLYYDNTGELCPSEKGLFRSIEKLDPDEVQVISGLVQFSPHCDDRLNRTVDITSTLSLQLMGRDSDRGALPIEQRVSPLQLTEGYVPPSDDYTPDVLLVTDATITRKLIDRWRVLLSEIGLESVSIWNMTLYGGLNLHQELQHGRSLSQDFSKKTIVIFNTDRSSDMWSMSDLFMAARDNDINTYIVGNKAVSFMQSLIPVDGDTPCTHRSSRRLIRSLIQEEEGRAANEYDTVEITKKYRFGREPKLKHLVKKAEEVNEALSEAMPDRCFVVGYDYQPQEVEDKYSLGTIVVHSSLKKSEASIASLFCRAEEVNERKEQHQYSLLKLLNFDQKLELISNLHSGRTGALLARAILSDIADEQKAYRQEKWKGEMSKDDIKEGLEKLRLLSSYDAKDGEEEFLINLLFHTKYLAERLLSIKDKMLPNRRGKIVTVRTTKLVNRALQRFEDELVSQCKTTVKDRLKVHDSSEALLKAFCDPFDIQENGSLMQDNTKEITESVMPISELQEVADKYHPRKIVEGRFILASKEVRQKAIQDAAKHVL